MLAQRVGGPNPYEFNLPVSRPLVFSFSPSIPNAGGDLASSMVGQGA